MKFMDEIRSRAERRAKGEYRAYERVRPGVCFAQHDMNIANAAGATVRTDINNALAALVSNSSGSTAPSTTFAYMPWYDTTTGTKKRRNAANSAWIMEETIDESFVIARSSNTILDESDRGKVLRATSGYTQTLTAAATLGDGWSIDIIVDSGATLVIDPNGAETVDGSSTKSVVGPAGFKLSCNGSAFFTDLNVTLNGTQTLTNKTLSDSTTYLADESDSTKKAQFQLSGITTGNTRTMTVPDASGSLAYGPGASGSGNVIADTSATATPSVASLVHCPIGFYINTSNDTYNITNLTGGVDGQVVVVMNTGTGTVTFTRDNAYLDGGANQAIGQYDSIMLMKYGSLWRQIGKLCSNS